MICKHQSTVVKVGGDAHKYTHKNIAKLLFKTFFLTMKLKFGTKMAQIMIYQMKHIRLST